MATSPIYSWPEPDNTDLVKNGALAIRTLGNAIDTTMATMTPKSIVDAKGDLIAASAADTPARLAVGNNGETLVADSSTSTGLRYGANFAAGKNKVINGDFGVNQRNFTSSTVTLQYVYDRFQSANVGGTVTFSAQTFTPGTAPVAGYEAKNYVRCVTTGQSAADSAAFLFTRLEGVRTFAGQTATISFWAKANTGTPKIGATALQLFGDGGSPSSPVVLNGQSTTISTSWARYSFTFSIPSIAGKTLGTAGNDSLQLEIWFSSGANDATRAGTPGIQSNTFEVWGVQLEAGSVATAFQTATGTIQGELAACQRYYARLGGSTQGVAYATFAQGYAHSTTVFRSIIYSPTIMRTAPSVSLSGSITTSTQGLSLSGLSGVGGTQTTTTGCFDSTGSGFTQYRTDVLVASNSTATFIEMSSEL
jgi:hypothetical protein